MSLMLVLQIIVLLLLALIVFALRASFRMSIPQLAMVVAVIGGIDAWAENWRKRLRDPITSMRGEFKFMPYALVGNSY